MPDNTFFHIDRFIAAEVMTWFSAKDLLNLILTTAPNLNKGKRLLALFSLFRKDGKKDIQGQTLFLKKNPNHPLLIELFNSKELTTFKSNVERSIRSKYSTAEHKRQILRLLYWRHNDFFVERVDLSTMLCTTPSFIVAPIRLLRGTINTLQRMRIDWLLHDMDAFNELFYGRYISQLNEEQMQRYIHYVLPAQPGEWRWAERSISDRIASLDPKQARQFACYIADILNTSDTYHDAAIAFLPHIANKLDKIQTQNVLVSLLKIFMHHHNSPSILGYVMRAIGRLSLNQIEDQKSLDELFACVLILIEKGPNNRSELGRDIIKQLSLNEIQTGEMLSILLGMVDGKDFYQLETSFFWLPRMFAVLHLNKAQTDEMLSYLLQIMDFIRSDSSQNTVLFNYWLFSLLAELQLNFDQTERLIDCLFGSQDSAPSLHLYSVTHLTVFFKKQHLHPQHIERVVNYFMGQMASGFFRWTYIALFTRHCLKEKTQAIKLLNALLALEDSDRIPTRDFFVYQSILVQLVPVMDLQQLKLWVNTVRHAGHLCYLISTSITHLDPEKALGISELVLYKTIHSDATVRGYFLAVLAKLVSILDEDSARNLIKQLLNQMPLNENMLRNRLLLFIYTQNYGMHESLELDFFSPSVFHVTTDVLRLDMDYESLAVDNRYLTIDILIQSILILDEKEDPIQYEGLITLLFVMLETELTRFIWMKPDTIVALVAKLERARAEQLIRKMILLPAIDWPHIHLNDYFKKNQVEMISHLILHSDYGDVIQTTLALDHHREDYDILKDMSNLKRLLNLLPQSEQTNDASPVQSCPRVFPRAYARVHS